MIAHFQISQHNDRMKTLLIKSYTALKLIISSAMQMFDWHSFKTDIIFVWIDRNQNALIQISFRVLCKCSIGTRSKHSLNIKSSEVYTCFEKYMIIPVIYLSFDKKLNNLICSHRYSGDTFCLILMVNFKVHT